MNLFLQLALNGVYVGSVYALLGLSFAAIFSTTKIWHFAQAAVYSGAALVVPVGELDLVSEPQFRAALEQARGKPAVVDLSELAFMDSTGLRAVLEAARVHPQLRLRGPLQPPVQRLLELTQTLTILPFEDA